MREFTALAKEVKLLLLQCRYQQCITICSNALASEQFENYDLHATYLYFYAAMSFEALARRMHHNSTALETVLSQAEESYLAADDALPMSKSEALLCGPNNRQYRQSLQDFHIRIQNHLAMLRDLQELKTSKRKKEQEGKKAPINFAPYAHPGFRMNIEKGGWQQPKMSVDEKAERIRQGRERQWTRDRFNALKYQDLCDSALAELLSVPANCA